jgi:hypothetical protein
MLQSLKSLRSRAAPATAFLCFSWLLLGFSAQVFVAVVGLTFETIDGVGYNDTFIQLNRPVHVPKLDCYYRVRNNKRNRIVGECTGDDPGDLRGQETLQTIAHSYGDAFADADIGFYNTTDDIINSKYDYRYWVRSSPEDFSATLRVFPRNLEYAYRYREYNPKDTQRVYPSFTNRIVTVSPGVCSVYETPDPPTLVPDLNGIPNVRTL